MSINTTATTSFVAKKMLEFNLGYNPIFTTANRDFEDQFNTPGYASGKVITIKVPGYPEVSTGLSVTPTPISDLTLPYALSEEDIYNVTYELDAFEEKFDFEGGSKSLTEKQEKAVVDNYAFPAYQVLQQKQENVAAFRFKTNALYTPIDEVSKLSGLNNFASVSRVTEFMDNMQLQQNNRTFMMNLKDGYSVSNSLQNSFNTALNKNVSRSAWVGGSAEKGSLAGMDLMKSTNLRKHVAGPLAGVSGITVASINSAGTSIVLTGVPAVSTNLIKAGDLISIPDVFLASPIDKADFDAKLVVCANVDADGDGAGNVTLTTSIPLLASGMHANVLSLPTVGNEVAVFPSHNVNYAYVPSGLSVVPFKLGKIHGADNSSASGLNACPVSAVMQGSVSNFANIFRITMGVGIRVFAPYVIAVPSSL